jgi:hypothetical protein
LPRWTRGAMRRRFWRVCRATEDPDRGLFGAVFQTQCHGYSPRLGIACANVIAGGNRNVEHFRAGESQHDKPSLQEKSDGEPTNSTCRAAVSRGQRSMTGCVPRRRYGKRKMQLSTKRRRSLFQPVTRRPTKTGLRDRHASLMACVASASHNLIPWP